MVGAALPEVAATVERHPALLEEDARRLIRLAPVAEHHIRTGEHQHAAVLRGTG